MVTFAQAQERAEEWVNGDVPAYQHREVRVREFELGFVVWAEDRAEGPVSDGGRQRLVIARDSGEATLWPGLPVGEVIRRYEEEYGALDAAAGRSGAAAAHRSEPDVVPAEPAGVASGGGGQARDSGPAGGAVRGRASWLSLRSVPPLSFFCCSRGRGRARAAVRRDAVVRRRCAGPRTSPPLRTAFRPLRRACRRGPPRGPGPTPTRTPTTGRCALPATVFAPPLSGADDDGTPPPAVSAEAPTALMSGGSELPRTAVVPGLNPQGPGAPGPGAPVPGVPGVPGSGDIADAADQQGRDASARCARGRFDDSAAARRPRCAGRAAGCAGAAALGPGYARRSGGRLPADAARLAAGPPGAPQQPGPPGLRSSRSSWFDAAARWWLRPRRDDAGRPERHGRPRRASAAGPARCAAAARSARSARSAGRRRRPVAGCITPRRCSPTRAMGGPTAPRPPGPPGAPGAPQPPGPPGPPGSTPPPGGGAHHAATMLAGPGQAGPPAPQPPGPPGPRYAAGWRARSRTAESAHPAAPGVRLSAGAGRSADRRPRLPGGPALPRARRQRAAADPPLGARHPAPRVADAARAAGHERAAAAGASSCTPSWSRASCPVATARG